MGKKRKFTEEEFVDAWMRNSSRSEICYELGLTPNGNTQRITDYAQELGLPSDHIVSVSYTHLTLPTKRIV